MPLAKATYSVLIDRLAGLAVTLVCFAVTLPWLVAAALIANMAATASAGSYSVSDHHAAGALDCACPHLARRLGCARPAEQALLLSILFGLALIASSVPALMLWLIRQISPRGKTAGTVPPERKANLCP